MCPGEFTLTVAAAATPVPNTPLLQSLRSTLDELNLLTQHETITFHNSAAEPTKSNLT